MIFLYALCAFVYISYDQQRLMSSIIKKNTNVVKGYNEHC